MQIAVAEFALRGFVYYTARGLKPHKPKRKRGRQVLSSLALWVSVACVKLDRERYLAEFQSFLFLP